MRSLIRDALVVISIAAACVLFATPVTAMAAQDTSYADEDSANNTPPCTLANPCNQINTAIGDTNANGTVIVDGGTYSQNVSLNGSKSLTGQDIIGAAEGTPVIEPGAGTGVSVDVGQTAGTIQGFRLRSTSVAVHLSGQAVLTNNVFDSTGAGTYGLVIGNAAGGSTIGPNNSFTDDGVDSEVRTGISVEGGNPIITGNTFTALAIPFNLTAGSPLVVGNTITGYHDTGPATDEGAISVGGGTPIIVANHIHSPDPNSSSTTGIKFTNGGPGGTLRRNRIFDHTNGVHLLNTTTLVTMHSDALVGNDVGLLAQDLPSAGSESDVTVANVTISGSATGDIQLAGNVLTLDSSIVEDPIAITQSPTCVITNSRGPTTTPGGDGCQNFQTTAAPMLDVDGFHLLAGSPMIDMGNPAAPVAPNDLDVDGDNRAIDENCDGVVRRNIGADEIPTTCAGSPPASPSPTPLTPTTPAAPPPKKCKKGRKLKKGKCVKKKRKKKK